MRAKGNMKRNEFFTVLTLCFFLGGLVLAFLTCHILFWMRRYIKLQSKRHARISLTAAGLMSLRLRVWGIWKILNSILHFKWWQHHEIEEIHTTHFVVYTNPFVRHFSVAVSILYKFLTGPYTISFYQYFWFLKFPIVGAFVFMIAVWS